MTSDRFKDIAKGVLRVSKIQKDCKKDLANLELKVDRMHEKFIKMIDAKAKETTEKVSEQLKELTVKQHAMVDEKFDFLND